jgi:hypothetical protein
MSKSVMHPRFSSSTPEAYGDVGSMDTPNYKWRDRIVLFTCWAILLFSAISNWADEAIAKPFDQLQGIGPWQVIETRIFIVLSSLILFAPVLVIILSRKSHSFSNCLRRFHAVRTFWLILFIANLLQLARFSEDLRRNLYVEFAMTSLGLIIIFWLFYGQIKIDIGKVVIVGITWMSMLTIRQTMSLLPGRIDFAAASLFAKGFILLHGFILIVVAFLPLALFIRLEWESIGRRILIEKLPNWICVAMLAFAMMYMLFFQWSRGISFEWELGYRLGVLMLVLSSGLFLLRVPAKSLARPIRERKSIPKSLYVGLLCLLFLAYGVMAVIIGINNLENMEFDAISYLTIAWRYAEGNVVVRGIWSPMISWLIAPLIRANINPHVGFFIVGGISGFVWILTTISLAKRYQIGRAMRLAITATVIGITLIYGYRMRAADLLGATFVCLYFYWITHPQYEQRPVRYGFLAGLSGAYAYYGKYYNLPFILASLALTAILFILHGRRLRSTMIGALVSAGILLLSVTPWVIALYHRYGELTISTSGGINHAAVGPSASGNLCSHSQLCDQPTDVLLPWEDLRPQYYIDYGWSPFESLDSFRHFLRVIKHNVWDWIPMMASEFGPMVPMTLLALGVAGLYFWPSNKLRFCYGWALLTVLLYISGYMLNFSHLRFYLAIFPIILIAGYSFAQLLFDKARSFAGGTFDAILLNVAYAAAMVVFIVAFGRFDYVKYYLQTRYDPCIKYDSEAIGDFLESPTAGSDILINHIAYYTKKRTVGVLLPENKPKDADRLLRDAGVRTYVISSKEGLAFELQAQFNYLEVLRTDICGNEYLVLKVPER